MGTKIHPTAVVDPSAEIADEAEIGPFAVIESGVRIGAGTRLMAHSFVGRDTILGDGNVIHPGAIVGHAGQDMSTTGEEKARLVVGDRNVFREYSNIHRGSHEGNETVIGNDNFIMSMCHVAHDCRLGDNIIMASGCLLAGHIEIEDRAFLSGNAAVHQFCRIGSLAMISGLTRVHKDVPPYFMVKGDSQVYGLNKVGMQRAGISEPQRLDVRRAYKLIYRRGLKLDQALRRIELTLSHSPHALHIVEFIRGSQRGICPHHRRGGPRV